MSVDKKLLYVEELIKKYQDDTELNFEEKMDNYKKCQKIILSNTKKLRIIEDNINTNNYDSIKIKKYKTLNSIEEQYYNGLNELDIEDLLELYASTNNIVNKIKNNIISK